MPSIFILATLDVAETVGGGLSRQGLYYIVGLLCAVVATLFWRMMADRVAFQQALGAVQAERIADRDKFHEQLTVLAKEGHATVAENGKAFWVVQRELLRLEPRRSKAALGPEPTSQVNLPPKEKP